MITCLALLQLFCMRPISQTGNVYCWYLVCVPWYNVHCRFMYLMFLCSFSNSYYIELIIFLPKLMSLYHWYCLPWSEGAHDVFETLYSTLIAFQQKISGCRGKYIYSQFMLKAEILKKCCCWCCIDGMWKAVVKIIKYIFHKHFKLPMKHWDHILIQIR